MATLPRRRRMLRKTTCWTVTLMLTTGGALWAADTQPASTGNDVLKGPHPEETGGAGGRGFSGERRPGMMARPGPGGPGGPMREPGQILREVMMNPKMELTADQKVKIRELTEAFAKDVQKFREEHKDEFTKLEADMKAARDAQDRDK